MRSPVVWLGGKSRLASRLDALLPQHNTYVEVFGGGASLLFHKYPSAVEVYNDIDEGLVNFFRVLRSPKKLAILERRLLLTPCSRTEFNNLCLTRSEKMSDIERAYRWFYVMRQSFGSQFGKSWGVSIHGSTKGTASCIHRYYTSVVLLEQACNRFQSVLVECQEWRKVCTKYDSKSTVLFLDPPYMPSTRKSGRYDYEMTEREHVDLLCYLLKCKSKVMLCGYDNPVYRKMLRKGWRKVSWSHRCCLNNRQGSANSRQHRVENVWLNYSLK